MIKKRKFYDPNVLLETAYSQTHIALENIYPKVSKVLDTPVGNMKFNRLVGKFVDRNSTKLHTPGPQYKITFADLDKSEFYNLFEITGNEIKGVVKQITNKITTNSDFKLLSNNPIFWLFYFCIRYYELKKDQKGLNTSLLIYALSNYPANFYTYFRYEPNEIYMKYTMDHLSNKFIMKQEGSLFGGLFKSINNSYSLLKEDIEDASDSKIIRFIQRIHNDQKSLLRNICDVYMKNRQLDKKIILNKSSNSDELILDDIENNTSIIDTLTNKIALPIITNGIDLKRAKSASQLSSISFPETRLYLSKILDVKYTDDITTFVSSVLFLYIYTDKRKVEDINSQHFLSWSSSLFRKTNSTNENIKKIKELLEVWATDTGINKIYKREATILNYKKALYWYMILSIQALNQ